MLSQPKKFTVDMYEGAKVEFIDPKRRNWGVICYVEGFGEEHTELFLTEEEALNWFNTSAQEYLKDKWRDEGNDNYASVTICAFKMEPYVAQAGYDGRSGYEIYKL